MLRYSLMIGFVVLTQNLFCQGFVNGSFENNTAHGDQINLSNEALNEMLPGITSFGSYGDVDIINSATYGGSAAQNKQWYIGITGGGTDIIALSLTKNLIPGKKYTISFYDRKHSGYNANPIQIGVSENNLSFGTAIYTCNESPILNLWTKRTFTFTATENNRFITVQMPVGDIYTWANIDNFVFEDVNFDKPLTVSNSTIIAVNMIQPVKDTTVAVNTKIPDSAETKPQILKYNRHRLKGRKLDIQETVDVTEASVKLMVWDKNRIDGDIVSIYLNGQLIEENLEVSKEKKEILIHLQSGSNMVVMHAINLGRIPPNTAALSINSNKHKLITLVSDLRKSGALEIIYNPEAVSAR